jgi:hypothetical protein
VVDDLPFGESNVPAGFKKLHYNRLREGVATPEFLDEVKKIVRSIKRKEYVGV